MGLAIKVKGDQIDRFSAPCSESAMARKLRVQYLGAHLLGESELTGLSVEQSGLVSPSSFKVIQAKSRFGRNVQPATSELTVFR